MFTMTEMLTDSETDQTVGGAGGGVLLIATKIRNIV